MGRQEPHSMVQTVGQSPEEAFLSSSPEFLSLPAALTCPFIFLLLCSKPQAILFFLSLYVSD